MVYVSTRRPYRGQTRRRFGTTGRKRKFMWDRGVVKHSTTDPNIPIGGQATFDLLADFRSRMGITLNLPEVTIWRIHLKMTILITLPGAGAGAPVFVSSYVDGLDNTLTTLASSAPYSEKYLIWEPLYVHEMAVGGGIFDTTNPGLFKEWDVKSHRKLTNLDESLFLQVAATNAVVTGIDAVYSVLVLLP